MAPGIGDRSQTVAERLYHHARFLLTPSPVKNASTCISILLLLAVTEQTSVVLSLAHLSL